MSRWLGVDYGDRRVGFAVSDPSGMIASPAGFLVRRAGKRAPVKAIITRAAELGAEAFVLGLPLDGNGDETARCAEVRVIASQLEARTGLPVRLVDERFTTAKAHRIIREMGGSTRGRKGDVDALAAVVLLEFALATASNANSNANE